MRALMCPFVAALVGACDVQADASYQGEVLTSVSGQITTELTDLPDVEALVLWQNSARQGDLVEGQRVPVVASFPSQYRINIFHPPKEIALNDYTFGGREPDESRIGIGFILVAPVGAPLGGEAEAPSVLALSAEYMLGYVEEDIQEGSFGEQLLGKPLPAGYHLLKVIDVNDSACPGDTFDCLRLAPDQEAPVNLRITDDVDSIDIPEWT